MNAHALGILELPRVLDLVADRASSALGAARVRAIRPIDDLEWLEGEHARVAAVRGLVAAEIGFFMEPIPDVERALDRLRIVGTILGGGDLLGIHTLLRSARRTRDALRDARRPAVTLAMLAGIANRLASAKELEDAIERVIADDGSVRDDASPALRRIRRELLGATGELVRLLERAMARLEPHQQVADMSVTIRNGRYVIPVRREARGAVGGIVHDASQTGATLFVEPPAAIEFGNRIRELEADEAEEVERILLALTDRVRPTHADLASSLEALVELDALYARARFAIDFACVPAELIPSNVGFVVHEGRHPLLVAQGIDVVPFDLRMEPEERTLLVSGPNTGGKTVLLKTLGLFSALAQSGVPAPVGQGSRIAIYDDIFADVGDEQSIEASLSTFSAHVKNLGEILGAATSRSLVLIDELGSGTDPLEGAALGGAILEELTRRAALTVATTHLGALKELAAEVAGVVNASLQFDAIALAPTYRLIKGIPGRSYGLSIARRLSLPEHVLARAEERVPQAERDVHVLLADLEKRDEAIALREREVRRVEQSVKDRARHLADRETKLRQRERDVERESRSDARRYLLDARAEIERTIKSLKRTATDELDEAARAARQTAERLAAEHGEKLREMDRTPSRERRRADERAPEAGDMVELSTLPGRTGRLLDVRDGEGVVAVGAIKMTLPLSTLRRSANQQPAAIVVPMMGDLPDVTAESEVDLRGMRVDEAEDMFLRALDAAVRADLRSLRVIHGKGTGALRERVTEMLRKDTRVKSFRLGAWNEGGIGVTVVDL
jgi:DNA mismatch repair protein MutS2